MQRPISPSVLALAGAGTLLSAGSCAGAVADPEGFAPGLLAIQLQPAAAIQLEMLDYAVTRRGGFERKGPVAVAQANAHNTFAFKVEGLPPAFDYALAVNADAKLLSADKLTRCRGGTLFNIDAGKSTAVSIRIQCDGQPTTGSAVVQSPDGPKVNQCPAVQALRAVPAAAPVGMKVMLKADVEDAKDGPNPLDFTWSTGSGALSGTNTETSFTCTRAGVARVTLELSDGDAACQDTSQFVDVTCTDAACLAANSCDMIGDFPGHAGSTAPPLAGRGGAGAGGESGSAGSDDSEPLAHAGAGGNVNAVSQSPTRSNGSAGRWASGQAGRPAWLTGIAGSSAPPSAGVRALAGAASTGVAGAGGSESHEGPSAGASGAAESGGVAGSDPDEERAGAGGVSGSPDLTPQPGDGEEDRNRNRNRRRGAGGEGGNAAETPSNGETAGVSGSAGTAPEEAGRSGSIEVEVATESDAGSGGSAGAGGTE